MSRLPEGTGVRSRSGVCVRKCSGNSKDLQFPHQQNDFASRDSERTGAQTPRLRQNRSPPEIYLEKRASVLSSFETRERQSRFRIRRKSAAPKKIADETSGGCSVIRPPSALACSLWRRRKESRRKLVAPAPSKFSAFLLVQPNVVILVPGSILESSRVPSLRPRFDAVNSCRALAGSPQLRRAIPQLFRPCGDALSWASP